MKKSKGNHPHWERRLSAWFDGECSDLDAAEVRAHLLDSPQSRAKLQEWRRLREDLSLLQPAAAGEEQLERMRLRFEDGLAEEVFQVSRALRQWNLAAAILLVLGLGFWFRTHYWASSSHQAYASEPSEVDMAIQELLSRPTGRLEQD